MELNTYQNSLADEKLDEKIIINGDKSKSEKEFTLENEHTDGSKMPYWLMQHFKNNFSVYRNITCALLYYCYFGYASYCHFLDDEASIRLTVCTGFGTFLILWNLLKHTSPRRTLDKFLNSVVSCYKFGRRPLFIRWALYIIFGTGIAAYIVVYVAIKEPSKLISLLGLVCFILLMALLSNNKKQIQWHTVFWGTVLQFLLGLFILKTEAGRQIVMWFSGRLQELISYSKAASVFIFGAGYMEHDFAFKILPSIIFFTTFVTLMQYLGVIQAIVRTMGRFLAFVLGVSAYEAMNASANIFVGGGESAVIVMQYLDSAPVSHLFTILTAGAASLGGAALIQFIAFGVPAEYLLSASVMSAPAAVVCSKIMFPDTDVPYHVADADVEVKKSVPEDQQQNPKRHKKIRKPKGVVEALVLGAQQGLKLVANIFGVLVVFLALVDFADATVMWLGERVDIHGLTLTRILSYIFYPFSFLMGVDKDDCLLVGKYLGIRTVALAPVAFKSLAVTLENGRQFESYTALYNSSWSYRGEDIFLQKWNVTLHGGIISERSSLIATYALCGFASITTVGLSLGAVGSLAPRRVPELSRIAPWAVVSGTLASYLTACVAGVLS